MYYSYWKYDENRRKGAGETNIYVLKINNFNLTRCKATLTTEYSLKMVSC
jgi:hypothetical protein